MADTQQDFAELRKVLQITANSLEHTTAELNTSKASNADLTAKISDLQEKLASQSKFLDQMSEVVKEAIEKQLSFKKITEDGLKVVNIIANEVFVPLVKRFPDLTVTMDTTSVKISWPLHGANICFAADCRKPTSDNFTSDTLVFDVSASADDIPIAQPVTPVGVSSVVKTLIANVQNAVITEEMVANSRKTKAKFQEMREKFEAVTKQFSSGSGSIADLLGFISSSDAIFGSCGNCDLCKQHAAQSSEPSEADKTPDTTNDSESSESNPEQTDASVPF
jgi:chromosome segregation ATPase